MTAQFLQVLLKTNYGNDESSLSSMKHIGGKIV